MLRVEKTKNQNQFNKSMTELSNNDVTSVCVTQQGQAYPQQLLLTDHGQLPSQN